MMTFSVHWGDVMTLRRRTCFLVVERVLPIMAVVLASLVAQVRGVMFGVSGACWGNTIYLVGRPDDHELS